MTEVLQQLCSVYSLLVSIKITVTSRDNSSASAECTVDFAQRLVAVSYTHLDVYKRQALHWSKSADAGNRTELCRQRNA